MTTPPITYSVARPRDRAPYHLVGEDGFTLCGWLVVEGWWHFAEPATLYWFGAHHVRLCRHCRRKAEAARIVAREGE